MKGLPTRNQLGLGYTRTIMLECTGEIIREKAKIS